MTGRIRHAAAAERALILLGRQRGQVIYPVNLAAMAAGLRARNHGRRRRASRVLEHAVRRGIVQVVP